MCTLRGVWLVSGLVAAAMLLPAAASPAVLAGTQVNVAYRDVGTDPLNTLPRQQLTRWADVLRTTRVLVHWDTGRMIKVKVLARRDFPIPRRALAGDRYQLGAWLDTTGGPGLDYFFKFTSWRRGSFCELNEPADARVGSCRTWATRSGGLIMRGPARNLNITKQIRWRVSTFPGDVRHAFDLAPDHGWYS
jgi:hypothetical protein